MDSIRFPQIFRADSTSQEVRRKKYIGIATSYFDAFEKNNALLRKSSNYGVAA